MPNTAIAAVRHAVLAAVGRRRPAETVLRTAQPRGARASGTRPMHASHQRQHNGQTHHRLHPSAEKKKLQKSSEWWNFRIDPRSSLRKYILSLSIGSTFILEAVSIIIRPRRRAASLKPTRWPPVLVGQGFRVLVAHDDWERSHASMRPRSGSNAAASPDAVQDLRRGEESGR